LLDSMKFLLLRISDIAIFLKFKTRIPFRQRQ
jgi:hypothetical protein